MFSLLTEQWLPVKYRDGSVGKIAPWQMVEPEILDLAYPRPDFQGAAYQFLIGLLQTAFSPEGEEEWEETLNGVQGEVLQEALSKLAPAMQFGEEKPAFMQDFSELDGDLVPISGLLIDAPGGNTLKLNKDHFVKRGVVSAMCPHCAAMALFTLQTNAPSGGQGHRTGMRGGGPMTTLVMPLSDDKSLWCKLWLNVLSQEDMSIGTCDKQVFPWLAETRVSDKTGKPVTPESANKLQAYWGMPRRIGLDFGSVREGQCDLCGEQSDVLFTHYRTKNYGVQYDGWLHPLTPYRKALKDEQAPMLSVKGQPGGLAYKDWLGLILRGQNNGNEQYPAKIVQVNAERDHSALGVKMGLWCFAFDMDNMKARCWYEHRIPISALSSEDAAALDYDLSVAVALAAETLPILRSALRDAWFESPKYARGDFSAIDRAYWQETEIYFSQLLHSLLSKENSVAALVTWISSLHRYVLAVYDLRIFSHPDNPNNLEREVTARKRLTANFYKLKSYKTLKEITKDREEVASV